MFTSKVKRNKVATSFKGDPGLTEKSHTKGCDVNYLVKRFAQTGQQLPELKAEHFADIPPIDLHQALNAVHDITSKFEQLPPEIRKRFDNDPIAFGRRMQNPDELQAFVENPLAISAERSTGDSGSENPAQTEAVPTASEATE